MANPIDPRVRIAHSSVTDGRFYSIQNSSACNIRICSIALAVTRSSKSANEFGVIANASPKGGCANDFSVTRFPWEASPTAVGVTGDRVEGRAIVFAMIFWMWFEMGGYVPW
jgi:hypothetical protein